MSEILQFPDLYENKLPSTGLEISEAIRLMVTTTPVPPQRADGLAQHYDALSKLPASADLVLLGDSLIANWPHDLWRGWLGGVVNLGSRGDRVQNVLWRAGRVELRSVQPQSVLLLIGTNNLPTDTASAIATGTKAVLSRIRLTWPSAAVILVEVPPRGEDFKAHAKKRYDYNVELRRLASEGWAEASVNIDHLITNERVFPSPHYHEDRLHLSRSGYEQITPYVKQEITALLR